MKFRTSLLFLGLIIIVACAVFLIAIAILDGPNKPEETTQAPSAITHEPFETEALEAAEVMTTWKPAEDFNRTEAETRAAYLMSEDLADSLESPERPASGQDWNQAAAASATSQPDVKINEHTDTEEGTVSVIATWKWATEDGETLESNGQQRIYYFTFNDQGEIHDYTYETVRHSQPTENEN